MMMFLSLALAGALALMLTLKIGLLVWGIRRNQRAGQLLREGLRERLQRLPIARMLETRDLDARAFLNQQRVVEIERQLRVCKVCEEKPRCLALLRNGADWTFCPLEEDVARLAMRAA